MIHKFSPDVGAI